MSDGHTHKYYLLGNTPVRVTFNAGGLKVGAEAPDVGTGELKVRPTLLSRVEASPDVDEITETQFNELCATSLKKNSDGPQVSLP